MTIKNVVLVHGAFADGSGWEAVANSAAHAALHRVVRGFTGNSPRG